MKIKAKKKESEISGSTFVLDLPVFTRPSYTDSVKWPADITQLPSQNVSELIGKYTGILAFVESLRAKVSRQIIEAEFLLEREETKIYVESPGARNLNKWQRDQVLLSDDAVVRHRRTLKNLRAYEKSVEMTIKNYERFIYALSRELSRKVASSDGSKFAKFNRE